jgi:hypothetical protein
VLAPPPVHPASVVPDLAEVLEAVPAEARPLLEEAAAAAATALEPGPLSPPILGELLAERERVHALVAQLTQGLHHHAALLERIAAMDADERSRIADSVALDLDVWTVELDHVETGIARARARLDVARSQLAALDDEG